MAEHALRAIAMGRAPATTTTASGTGTRTGTTDTNLTTNTNISDEPIRQVEIRFTPAEMRLRMIEELRKQEEIFVCAMELSQLEQAHAVQSASQVTPWTFSDIFTYVLF